MYIPEFWAGVIITVLVEFLVILGYGLWVNYKRGKK